jgi:hypothetical protein
LGVLLVTLLNKITKSEELKTNWNIISTLHSIKVTIHNKFMDNNTFSRNRFR